MVVIVLFFGLRPKMEASVNHVIRTWDGSGLSFQESGIAYVDDLHLLRGFRHPDVFSIELVVQTKDDSRLGFRPILLLHDGDDRRQLAVWQWGMAVIVMNGDDYDYSRRWPRLSANAAFQPGKPTYLTVTAGRESTRLYLNGVLTAESRVWQASIPHQGNKLRLVLGNSVYGRHGWTGDLYGLAICAGALSDSTVQLRYNQWKEDRNYTVKDIDRLLVGYDFQEDTDERFSDHSKLNPQLQIPARITPLKKAFLTFPWHESMWTRSFAMDALVNFLGFVPLGFLLHGWLKLSTKLHGWRVFTIAVVSCLVLSFAIECAQAYIPGRFSSLIDVLTNTMGAAGGATILGWLNRNSKRIPRRLRRG